MRKLSGIDAGFLYNETDLCPQQVATVQLMELPEGVGVDAFVGELKRLLLARIHLVPYLTDCLVTTPLLFDHPVWQTDASFDIENHVSCMAVPAPGGRREWESVVARLHEQPFDRTRPLWRIVVLTGLEQDRIAYYHAMHHACIDGVTGQSATERLMDCSPTPRAVEPVPEDFFRPGSYSALDLMSAAVGNLIKAQARQFANSLNALETGIRLQRRTLEPTAGFGALLDPAPPTRLNRSIDGKRTYATGEIPMRGAKQIAHAVGCTLNDLFVALCGGALRDYLQNCGELPEDSLIAGCPVSLQRAGRDAEGPMATNQLTMMQVSLATDEPESLARLRRVAASSRTAKSVTADLAGVVESNPVAPGLPLAVQALARFVETSHAADHAPVPFNVVVSNVPGPRQTLYSAGARMLSHYPVSIPTHGLGVNITVQSYAGSLYFGITACARTLPDPDRIGDAMLREFAALKELLLSPRTSAHAMGRTARRRRLVVAQAAHAA